MIFSLDSRALALMDFELRDIKSIPIREMFISLVSRPSFLTNAFDIVLVESTRNILIFDVLRSSNSRRYIIDSYKNVESIKLFQTIF